MSQVLQVLSRRQGHAPTRGPGLAGEEIDGFDAGGARVRSG